MKWTVGVVTDGNNPNRVQKIIRSIVFQPPDDRVQIIIVGGKETFGLLHIPFDEDVKRGWITRKKNIVAHIALYDNVVLVHDYVSFEPGWFDGFDKFGDNWLTCMTPVRNLDGSRFRDWAEIYNNSWMEPPIDNEPPPVYPAGKLISYDSKPNPRWQYYSGAYYCIKKEVALAVPLDESRTWGQGEDVQASRLLYKKYGGDVFSLNPYSSVRFLKQKERAPWE